MRRVAVLISGSGSNLQALIDSANAKGSAAEIALVISNRADAYGRQRARRAGIEELLIDHKGFPDRESFERAIDDALRARGIELVCLAGFMRILGARFVEAWRGRMLNIHPSLLPAFRGLNTHGRALAAGVRVSGCSVHFVTPELDDGPILVQGLVPVLEGDDVASLTARVQEIEHRCYPQAMQLVASGRLALEDGRVRAAPGIRRRRLILHELMLG